MNADAPIPGQLVVPAAVIGFLAVMAAFLLLVVVAIAWHWVRDRLRTADVSERQLLEDLGAHLTQFGLDDPELGAGFARLDAAVSGERWKGGSA
jgi:hypothetical protein